MTTKENTLANRIKATMASRGITQKELAARLGLHPVVVSTTINNPNVRVSTLERYAAAIGCSVAEFFTDPIDAEIAKLVAEKYGKDTPSMHSPKNPYRVEIHYDKALKNLGSVSSFGGMTIEVVDGLAIGEVKRNKMGAQIIVKHNVAGYPDFDWKEVKSYHVNKNGKAD